MDSEKSNVSILKKKKILLGITGSIAAYKAAGLCSKLINYEAEVFPVMTPSALNFINPITFSVISGKKTLIEQFKNEEKVYHIELSHNVDIILIAPATANTISKLAAGICDNFLTTTVISSNCPVLLAPAMNQSMYLNEIIQKNIKKLEETGKYFIIEPEKGRLACGEEGIGRFASEEKIIEKAVQIISYSEDLKGKKIIVTAGGTKEYIDSVRFISNKSSGKMGYSLAQEAFFRGADEVLLISTVKNLPAPYGVKMCYVSTTNEMKNEILNYFESTDIIIMAAAVSDIIPVKEFNYKLKKNDDIISKLNFKENINILQLLSKRKNTKQFLAGFSAESGENIENAKEKIAGKKIDMIILNDISRNDIGFGSDYNEVILIDKKGILKKIPKNKKNIISRLIWDEIVNNLKN